MELALWHVRCQENEEFEETCPSTQARRKCEPEKNTFSFENTGVSFPFFIIFICLGTWDEICRCWLWCWVPEPLIVCVWCFAKTVTKWKTNQTLTSTTELRLQRIATRSKFHTDALQRHALPKPERHMRRVCTKTSSRLCTETNSPVTHQQYTTKTTYSNWHAVATPCHTKACQILHEILCRDPLHRSCTSVQWKVQRTQEILTEILCNDLQRSTEWLCKEIDSTKI